MDTDRPKSNRVEVENVTQTTNWSTQPGEEAVNNHPTLLYIAVEYVKDYKCSPDSTVATQEVYSDFDSHVSPLDPNMSSVASYSPVYTEYNPVVIHQLVNQEDSVQNEQYISDLTNTPLDSIPTVLCNNVNDVSNEYLQMVDHNDTEIVNRVNSNNKALQLVPEREQKVELLITDEATGISYSVDAQELLVEPCIQDDRQLLESIAPEPILESDLLTLDERTLKSELNDDLDICQPDTTTVSTETVNSYVNNLPDEQATKSDVTQSVKINTRQNRKPKIDSEDQMLPCVYTITDKPLLSRARATLPESYLSFGKVNGETTVVAKTAIPKRSQFGPLKGILVPATNTSTSNYETDQLMFFIETDGILYRIDVSDENNSNWMMFVRKAMTYEEQNLIITQENSGIYFTTTTNIAAKQELKVWYGSGYAKYYNLPTLQPVQQLSWPCYECTEKFESSEELQKHLDVHDVVKDENTKPRKKVIYKKKKSLKRPSDDAMECQLCKQIFFQFTYNSLRLHILQKHESVSGEVEEHFKAINFFKCNKCNVSFKSEILLLIHNYKHDPDSCEEQRNHVCPECQKKYPTQRQLVLHISQHALPVEEQQKKIKCKICHKLFSHEDRLKKHLIVHGSDDAKPLQCQTCNKRFLNNSALSCHVKTHYSEKKPFECPICKESFDMVLKLKLHVPKHCHNNSFTCPHCNKVFKKYCIIRKHIRAFHCEKTHECTSCSKVFPTLDKYKTHLLRHSNHKEFLCAHCGKQFKKKDKLKIHCQRVHSENGENNQKKSEKIRKNMPSVEPTNFHRFIYKCHTCMVGFKRRGMLVNHLAKRHPDIPPDSVPELNLPILQTKRDYCCQYCHKVYKSSSKRKEHILKNHPGAPLPVSSRSQGSQPEVLGVANSHFSQTVGSITTRPQNCKWCHRQYASKAKLLQHQRKKHPEEVAAEQAAQSKDQLQENKINSNNNKLDNKKTSTDDPVAEFDKVVENMISSELGNFNLEETQYCHLGVNGNENFIEASELETPNSHLYRLLVENNDVMPPR